MSASTAAPARQSVVIASHALLDRLRQLRPQVLADQGMRTAFEELARLYMGVLELAAVVDPALAEQAVPE
jgi:hypothetical protein